MKPKKRLLQANPFDATLTTLLATGMASLAGGAYVFSAPDAAEETARAPDAGETVPPLHDLVPDTVLPNLAPNLNAPVDELARKNRDAASVSAAAALDEAVPQVDWQAALMPEALAMLPPLPQLPPQPELLAGLLMEVTPPPVIEMTDSQASADDEMVLQEDDAAPNTGMVIGAGATSGGAAGHSEDEYGGDYYGDDYADDYADDYGGGVAAPTAQEREEWDELFGSPSVPQSMVINLDNVFLAREASEERLLFNVIFNDPLLDSGGVSIDPHPLLEVRNGNELWLLGGHDLTDPFYVPQTYVRIYALNDPSAFASFVLYIMDDPQPGENPDIEAGNPSLYGDMAEDDEEAVEEDPNGGQYFDPFNPQPQGDTYQAEGQMDYGESGDDFGEMMYEYYQGPDIV